MSRRGSHWGGCRETSKGENGHPDIFYGRFFLRGPTLRAYEAINDVK